MEKPSSFFYLTPWFSDMKIDTNKCVLLPNPVKVANTILIKVSLRVDTSFFSDMDFSKLRNNTNYNNKKHKCLLNSMTSSHIPTF